MVPALAAAADSGAYHPNMFAAALALGLVAVAFILTLVFFRNAPCSCCRRRAGSYTPPAAAADDDAGSEKKKRTVVSVMGSEGAVASPATDDALISVSTSGGEFVLYTGSATEQAAAGGVV